MARSRGECEEIIARGEAVLLLDGRSITRVEDLPSAVELAGDDIVKKNQAVADLQAARDALDRQIAAVSSGQAVASATPVSFESELAASLGGFPPHQKAAHGLVAAGFDSPEKLRDATDEELHAVDGVGDGTIAKLRELYPAQ